MSQGYYGEGRQGHKKSKTVTYNNKKWATGEKVIVKYELRERINDGVLSGIRTTGVYVKVEATIEGFEDGRKSRPSVCYIVPAGCAYTGQIRRGLKEYHQINKIT